jgi:DNA modification methylase
MRIKKLNTPIFFTTTTKFGVELINNAPKKCPFRYDLVWVKSSPAGFLSAKKMPMRKHEMIYVFYEKLPLYDLSSHTHKFIKETENKRSGKDKVDNKGMIKNRSKTEIQNKYEPPLPVSVVKEEKSQISKPQDKDLYGAMKGGTIGNIHGTNYDPPLPNSLLEIKSTRGKHSTEKPVALMEWVLKYYSKEGDTILDPTMGSGSTGVACKNMNRNFIGIEKDPEIYEVAVNRIED